MLNKTARRLGAVLVLLLAACGPAGTPEPTLPPPETATAVPTGVPATAPPKRVAITPLPTAVPPESLPGSWAVSFQHAFPAGFWPLGIHRYGFLINCPELDQEDFSSELRDFEVTEEAILHPEPVYIRVGGLGIGLFALSANAVHPDQETIAAITILGISREEAAIAAESPDCVALFGYDRFPPVELVPQEPFQP